MAHCAASPSSCTHYLFFLAYTHTSIYIHVLSTFCLPCTASCCQLYRSALRLLPTMSATPAVDACRRTLDRLDHQSSAQTIRSQSFRAVSYCGWSSRMRYMQRTDGTESSRRPTDPRRRSLLSVVFLACYREAISAGSQRLVASRQALCRHRARSDKQTALD